MNSDINFTSPDIYLCAYLVAEGAELEGTERNTGRVHFNIRRDEGLDDLLQAYWSNKPLSVVPAKLFASLKYLKSLIHADR